MAFDYQTNQSTLLGALDELRIPALNNLYDYMPVLSGADGLGGIGDNMLATINAANPRAIAKNDPDDEDETVEIVSIDGLRDFLRFARRPGQRDVGGTVTTTFTKTRTVKGTFGDDIKSTQVTQELWFPLSFIIQYRGQIGDAPDDFALNLVKARGDAMTDQEIDAERAKAASQKAEQDRANKLAASQAPDKKSFAHDLKEEAKKKLGVKKAPAARPAPPPPPPPESPAVLAAAEKNKASSKSLEWGVNLAQYDGGPGDVSLAKDVAVFQQVAQLAATGVVDKAVLAQVKAIRTRVLKEGKGAKVDPRILKFVNAIQIKGFADPRTTGGTTQAVYEKKYGNAPSAKPIRKAMVAKKVEAAKTAPVKAPIAMRGVASGTLSAAQLAAARKANVLSATKLGWKTAPGVYTGAGDAKLAQDVAHVQVKYRISGTPGVITSALLAKLKSQQLSGLGAVSVDNSVTMGAVTRLMNGVVIRAGASRAMPAGKSGGMNWLLIGGGALLLGAVGYGVMQSRKKTSEAVPPAKAPEPVTAPK